MALRFGEVKLQKCKTRSGWSKCEPSPRSLRTGLDPCRSRTPPRKREQRDSPNRRPRRPTRRGRRLFL